ncbi:ABATE domain-containing protein [Streptomyces hygroscopicus]|uniref:ABATE domain-containing protein n=1 Tax=Streptomyces hygroscopicus TaxID=1912 RepID=UPI00362BF059
MPRRRRRWIDEAGLLPGGSDEVVDPTASAKALEPREAVHRPARDRLGGQAFDRSALGVVNEIAPPAGGSRSPTREPGFAATPSPRRPTLPRRRSRYSRTAASPPECARGIQKGAALRRCSRASGKLLSVRAERTGGRRVCRARPAAGRRRPPWRERRHRCRTTGRLSLDIC